ncbi:unnamed protein product [Cercospora beticola]|nr:unnamed protein product [Cercospora beticola]
MAFTNGFAPLPAETVQHIGNSSTRNIQAVGCLMRTSSGDRSNDIAFEAYGEENLVLIERFEQGNLVNYSPFKVTPQRLDRKETDAIAFILSDRQSPGDRECVLGMNRLRIAYPRDQVIHLNLIVSGPDGLTATQDQYARWASYWETQGVFVTLYIYQKVVRPEIMATVFFRRYMRWSARMDGYLSEPIVNAASVGARDPDSVEFYQKVHDFWDLNNMLAQGKHNCGRRVEFEDLPEA